MSRRLIAGLVCLMVGILSTPAIADAAPKQVARIAKSEKLSALRTDIWVFSPAMNERIKLSVLTPVGGSTPRSTVYMLDGAGAEGEVSDWITKGRAGRFFADKNVNVVLPTGGKGTFYTDWQKKDAALGKTNFVTLLGLEAARQRVAHLANQARSHLEPFGDEAEILRASVDFVLKRRS